MAAGKTAKKSAKASASGFSAAERDAIREYAKEKRAEQRGKRDRADGERAVLAKIAEMPETDRAIAARLHEIVSATAPDLVPRTWYGMPAYAKDGDVLCFFQAADKFKARYPTLGFSDKAKLDQGSMWPTSFALTKLTKGGENDIRALLRKAVG